MLVLVCLVLTAILIPVGFHLHRAVEAELVLGAWWLIWFLILSVLLYRGNTIDDECRWLRFGGGKSAAITDSLEAAGCAGDLGGLAFGEGCWIAVASVLAVILFIGALAVLVEFVIPALLLVLLASVGGMLARAVNDRHQCQHHAGRSLLWALIWSTVYVGPVAALVLAFLTVLPQK